MMRVTRASLPKKSKQATKKCLITNVELVKVDSLDSPDSVDSLDSLTQGRGKCGEVRGVCVTIINN